MAFKKRIKIKLIVGFLIGVLSIGLISLYSHYKFNEAQEIIEQRADILKLTHMMALRTKDSFDTLNLYLFIENSTELENLRNDYAVSSYNANKYLIELRRENINSGLLDQLEDLFKKNQMLLQEMIYFHDMKFLGNDNVNISELESKENDLFIRSKEINDKVYNVLNLIIDDSSILYDQAISEYERIRYNVKIILIIIILYSAGLAIFIANSLSKPISYLTEMANEVGQGNLDVEIRVKTKDELGELGSEFNLMTKNLKKSQEAIKEKNAKLDESNKLKDMFIDIMSHDILNPLAAIKGIGTLLKSKYKGKEPNIIVESANDAIDIIDNTKKLALIEDGSIPKKEMDLKDVIKDLCKQLSLSYKEKNVRIINKIKKELPIKANPLIGDIFLNFLTNALKYAGEGKKVVIDAEKEKGGYIIKVMDFGQGIPDKYKESIFTRFSRREREGVKGTGLGLTIAKKLVELHKGKVWVEDNPKGGSVFVVTLPLDQES